MSYTCFKNGLLRGYTGEHGDFPCFTWTYDDFEKYVRECITPSMYRFMAEYVQKNLSNDEMYDIQCGEYCPGELEELAVNAYFEVPILTRIELHKQMLEELQNDKAIAEAKEAAAISAMLDEDMPFDGTSPIAQEYCDFMRGIISKNRAIADRLENEILEEEQWRGGHEAGAENEV